MPRLAVVLVATSWSGKQSGHTGYVTSDLRDDWKAAQTPKRIKKFLFLLEPQSNTIINPLIERCFCGHFDVCALGK